MQNISDANNIREYVYQTYILPAKKNGLSEVSVLARIVHEEMGFKKQNYPNIIRALVREKMKIRYGLKTIRREPPADGPNVQITFIIK
jgi:hypothetical protein